MMVDNSTYEEEIKWLFLLGRLRWDIQSLSSVNCLLFVTAKVFKEAVKKQAIVERKPTMQKINYDSRVKFVLKWLLGYLCKQDAKV